MYIVVLWKKKITRLKLPQRKRILNWMENCELSLGAMFYALQFLPVVSACTSLTWSKKVSDSLVCDFRSRLECSIPPNQNPLFERALNAIWIRKSLEENKKMRFENLGFWKILKRNAQWKICFSKMKKESGKSVGSIQDKFINYEQTVKITWSMYPW